MKKVCFICRERPPMKKTLLCQECYDNLRGPRRVMMERYYTGLHSR